MQAKVTNEPINVNGLRSGANLDFRTGHFMKSRAAQDDWPFTDPKNLAVFTTSQVVRLRQAILYVSHDDKDGAWQFHTGKAQVSTADMLVVALEEVAELDPTVCELADLPCGWIAERDAIGSPWRRVQR